MKLRLRSIRVAHQFLLFYLCYLTLTSQLYRVQAHIAATEPRYSHGSHRSQDAGGSATSIAEDKRRDTSQQLDLSGAQDYVDMGQLKQSKILAVLSRRKRSEKSVVRDEEVASGKHQSLSLSTASRQNSLFVRLGSEKAVSEPSTQTEVVDALASMLNLPPSHVIIKHIQVPQNTLEVSFLKPGHILDKQDNDALIVTNQIALSKAKRQLSQISPSLQVQDVFTQDQQLLLSAAAVGDSPTSDGSIFQSYLPYIIGATTLLTLSIVILSIWCYARSRRKNAELYSSRSSPSPPGVSSPANNHHAQQICLYPAAKPNVNYATLIQPEVTQIYTNKSCGECGTPFNTPLHTPLHTPPMRIKKGLLERRGSNASLTLNLGSETEKKPKWGSPPRESSTEEYLLSAGNRMSRKELRTCLKNVRLLYEEFWEIPMNHPSKLEIPGAGIKNRYRTIIPNMKTRVCLPETEEEPASSYINANYIRGYGAEPRSYIATQGPMGNTVSDFWLMLWQERAPVVVMITKLKEKNKIKCESYLPEHEATFGDITVKVLRITEREGYILRQLSLTCGEDTHKILHYWYTAWPDHKAPDTARTLLDLVKEVERQRCDPDTGLVKGPVTVHCSAGIGRTGCFIGTSIGLQQLREEYMVDILGIVCSMRMDRGGMVQTSEQYEFVHQALCLYEKELPQRPRSGEH